MDASLLSKAMEAEEKLISREKRGDGLEELPPGHPLLIAIETARQRLEERQGVEEERVKQKKKKAKKVDARRKSRQIERQKEEKNNALRNEVRSLNDRLDRIAGEIEEFVMREVPEFEEKLQEVPYIRSRFDRIRRMFTAFHRGVMDSKFRVHTFIEE
jgi:predicted RNase H-like nuclease (RuvC/YqgF family)